MTMVTKFISGCIWSECYPNVREAREKIKEEHVPWAYIHGNGQVTMPSVAATVKRGAQEKVVDTNRIANISSVFKETFQSAKTIAERIGGIKTQLQDLELLTPYLKPYIAVMGPEGGIGPKREQLEGELSRAAAELNPLVLDLKFMEKIIQANRQNFERLADSDSKGTYDNFSDKIDQAQWLRHEGQFSEAFMREVGENFKTSIEQIQKEEEAAAPLRRELGLLQWQETQLSSFGPDTPGGLIYTARAKNRDEIAACEEALSEFDDRIEQLSHTVSLAKDIIRVNRELFDVAASEEAKLCFSKYDSSFTTV
jgi:hypothetical protein